VTEIGATVDAISEDARWPACKGCCASGPRKKEEKSIGLSVRSLAFYSLQEMLR
jgi:hypothetical protein